MAVRRQVVLPEAGLALSTIGLGCWTLGGLCWGRQPTSREAIRTIHAALEAGVNWVDTAPLYGRGHADRIVAEALAERSDVVIATKCGVRWDGEHAMSDLRPDHVERDVELSLRRLGRESLDLVQIHWPCERGTPLEDTLGRLVRLQEMGKIRAIGLCNYGADELRLARSLAPVVSLQTPFSLLRREFEGDLSAEARRLTGATGQPVAVFAYETLCRGLLTGRFQGHPAFVETDLRSRDERFAGPRLAHAQALIRDLKRVSVKVELPLAALSVAWVLSKPGVSCAVVGARTPQQIQQTARAMDLFRREKVWSVMDRIAAVHGGWPP